MRIVYAICFAYLWAGSVTSSWLDALNLPLYFQQLSDFLQNPMANSWIPTFILDTDHPWLSANRRWLESYPDVASSLCDKSSPLWTSPSSGREIPTDLFHRINIDNNKAGVNRLGWYNAVSRLGELRDCAAALEDIRHLHVYIYVHSGQYSDPLVDPKMPPELPGLFAEVLARMPHLQRLDWGLDAKDTVSFRDEFVRRSLTLPGVRHLVPGAQSHYLLPMCPSLETLEAGSFFHHASWNSGYRESRDSRLELVRTASAVSSLKEFLMLDNDWTTEKLEEVLGAMPNLLKFTMQGSLGGDRDWREDSSSEDGRLLRECLSVISKFAKLEQLHLPDSSELDLGFDGGHWCGNAYMGESGRRYGRSVVKDSIDATELAGNIVMEAIPHLNILSISGTQANFTRNERGELEIMWPWTGRKDEYISEIYPL